MLLILRNILLLFFLIPSDATDMDPSHFSFAGTQRYEGILLKSDIFPAVAAI